MTDGLVAFLRARLDEDEQAARAADGAEWTVESRRKTYDIEMAKNPGAPGCGIWVVAGDDSSYGVADTVDTAHARHIAGWDPARVLAEVDAKRSIVNQNGCAALFEPESFGLADMTLRLLALPYREHPDYRPEWAPDGEGA